MNSILFSNIENVLNQLKCSLYNLSDEVYSKKSKILFEATIGEHTRHILELYTCLINQYEIGVVNYDSRKRDYELQTNKNTGINQINSILKEMFKPNRNFILQAYDSNTEGEFVNLQTNYYRELAYNIEHTIHHMAMIRIAISELTTTVISDDYGVAPSTIKYRKECAQ